MTIWISTNGRKSDGARHLSKQPGFARLLAGSPVKPSDTIINWGSTSPMPVTAAKGYNNPYAVGLAVNKLTAFIAFSNYGVPVVEWTDSQQVAQGWSKVGSVVVVRGKLTGHEGDGIIVVEKYGPVPEAKLYTKYVFKDAEYRIHVVNGVVIDTARKIRDPKREPSDWKVRSWKNGFIFARKNIWADAKRDEAAIMAIKALGLDFGAVDLLIDQYGKYYVLEVNTAPGIEGQTIESYAKAFGNGAV